MSNIQELQNEYTFGYDPASSEGDYSTVVVMKGNEVVDHLVSIKHIEQIRKQAIENVLKAWNVKGSNPQYHSEQKYLLSKNWRTLYDALSALNELE